MEKKYNKEFLDKFERSNKNCTPLVCFHRKEILSDFLTFQYKKMLE